MTDPTRVLAVGGGNVGTAVALRLRKHLDIASATRDAAAREAALAFVFAGGGYVGVEALAELEDLARCATRSCTGVRPEGTAGPAAAIRPRGGSQSHRTQGACMLSAPRTGDNRVRQGHTAGPTGSQVCGACVRPMGGAPSLAGESGSATGGEAEPAERTLAGLFKREIVALGSLEHPRAEFALATRPGRGPDGD